MPQTIRQARALDRCHISRQWSHQHGHYHFLRTTPVAQRAIPFARPRIERVCKQWPQILDAVIGTLALAALVGVLAYAPVWTRWLP